MIAGKPEDLKDHMLQTYKSLRWLMAVVAALFLLTFALYRQFGHDSVERDSISAYYYHDASDFRMKDVFVSTFASIGLLLIAYQGYTKLENWALNAAGLGLLLVLACPMDWPPVSDSVPVADRPPLSNRAMVHYASAVVFFLGVAYVTLFRAHDTLDIVKSRKSKMAYKIAYRVTGFCMGFVPVLALVLHYVFRLASTVFWVEYAGVTAFLLYWVIKSVELQNTKLETQAGLHNMAASLYAAPKV